MASTNINIRMDADLKQLFNNIGQQVNIISPLLHPLQILLEF